MRLDRTRLAKQVKECIINTLAPEIETRDQELREMIAQLRDEIRQEVIVYPGASPCGYGNPATITVAYDGGYLYSVMTAEYGWDTRELLEDALGEILDPLGLYIEEVSSVAFTLAQG